MSRETGCIVMLKVTQDSIKVMGSLTREQSLGLAADIQGWHADIPKVIAPNKKLQLVN
jgi:hypothetical protein